MKFTSILAADEADVIGRDNALPWHIPADLARFQALTKGHAVVVGRRTHESIVARLGRPLPGRISVVVTGDRGRAGSGSVIYQPTVGAALSVAAAIERFAHQGAPDDSVVFVIGGAAIYVAALPQVQTVLLTRVHTRVDGDVRMPDGWLAGFDLVSSEPQDGSPAYTFMRYERR